MAWKKPPASLVDAFHGALSREPRIEHRLMFGYPCAFVNRNMFAGLHQDNLFVRLGEEARAELLRQGGRPFEPLPGRVMWEYVVVPAPVVSTRRRLARWLEKGVQYASALPTKRKKTRRALGNTTRRMKRTKASGRALR